MTTRETALWMATAWAIAVVVLLTVLCWRHGLMAASCPGVVVGMPAAAFAGIEGTAKLWALAVACGWLVSLVLMVAVFS